MPNHKQADLKKVRTIPLKSRRNKVGLRDFSRLYDPKRQPFSDFVESLPRILAAEELRRLVDDIAGAHKEGKPVIVMAGAHVIKVGLSPLLIDLIKRRIITCLAINGAAAIHDVEIALIGKTSEDVGERILDGSFGMSRETGEFINGTLRDGIGSGNTGYGEALGKALLTTPMNKISLLAACYSADIPATVHAAIGTDIIHQHPDMDGAVTGEMTFRDFKVFCNVVRGLKGGGVVINIGSAVIMPEVFLKAVNIARNLGAKVRGFTAANFDMIRHYRPLVNVVRRPTIGGGKGFMFTGHHEVMIPLLCAMVKDRIAGRR